MSRKRRSLKVIASRSPCRASPRCRNVNTFAWSLPTFHGEPASDSSLFQVLSAPMMGDHPRCCVRSGEPAGFTGPERSTDAHDNHGRLPRARLGAESGRGLLGHFDGSRLALEEI